MTNAEIRKAFDEIAEHFARNEEEKILFYQFLNNLTINNTNEQIKIIINLIKINM